MISSAEIFQTTQSRFLFRDGRPHSATKRPGHRAAVPSESLENASSANHSRVPSVRNAAAAAMSAEDHAVRWEEAPLTMASTSTENVADTEKPKQLDGQLPFAEISSPSNKKTLKHRALKLVKILLPHVGLTVVLLSYICFGAVVLQALESETELKRRQTKLVNITRIYAEIINSTWIQCEHRIGTSSIFQEQQSFSDWKMFVQGQLTALSAVHEFDVRQPVEEQGFTLDPGELRSRWTFQASVLYALTVLTTTGYDHITPQTDAGKILSVFFGLVGIPLMFITAADIGKFLSEIFLRLYAKFIQLRRYIYRKIVTRFRKKESVNGRLKNLEERTDDGEDDESEFDEEDPTVGRPELPIFAYFGLILTYCSLGGLLYTRWETGPLWTFLHAFHFSFNTITTISLGNILVRDPVYLCFIVCYIIIGLAVVTMCVDLASSQLKVFFTKLHYFGRKMRGARSAFANMSDDIKEAMKIIATIRKNKQGKDDSITVEDIKQYLEIQHQYLMTRPYIPNSIRFIKFVDEEDRESAISGSGIISWNNDFNLQLQQYF